jgi:hypothetical protein
VAHVAHAMSFPHKPSHIHLNKTPRIDPLCILQSILHPMHFGRRMSCRVYDLATKTRWKVGPTSSPKCSVLKTCLNRHRDLETVALNVCIRFRERKETKTILHSVWLCDLKMALGKPANLLFPFLSGGCWVLVHARHAISQMSWSDLKQDGESALISGTKGFYLEAFHASSTSRSALYISSLISVAESR